MDMVFRKGSDKKPQWHYDKMYQNHVDAWGEENVYPVIMEDVWQDTSGLADFLDVKIDKMHRNCYWPEMGINIPKYQWLKDQWQWESNPVPYDYLRERLDFLYVNFEKKFGVPANYPRLKGLNSRYSKITVVERKAIDKGPSFGEQFHTDSIYTKKPPRFTMLLSKLVPKKGKANTEFCSQYLAYKELPNSIKRTFKNIKGE